MLVFIEYKWVSAFSETSLWVNLTSGPGVILIPNGKDAFIPYLNATLISDNLADLIPCKQISSGDGLNEFMNFIKTL